MPNFNSRINKSINNLDVSVYDIDLNNSVDLNKLEVFLKDKIKKMKIHSSSAYLNLLDVPNIKPELRQKISEKIKESNNPRRSDIVWFDVRRSRITEFMSQCLLEKKYNCVFYEEADKRINLSAIETDKHVQGVDVTGIRQSNGSFKFVVCEVKSSKDKVPSKSSSKLLEDIQKGYTDENKLNRELLDYFTKLKLIQSDEQLSKILEFLFKLITESSSHKTTLNNVIFFPFLIRQNEEIIAQNTIDDFKDFKKESFADTSIHGIIWCFNTDIDEFCKRIYDEALKNA